MSVPFLQTEIARAQAAAAAAQQRVDAAGRALAGGQTALAAAREQLGGQQAQVSQLAAARDAAAAQAAGVATLLEQARGELAPAQARRSQAQAALDDHLLTEPNSPEGEGNRPPTPAEIAAWRRALKLWQDALEALKQAVADADAAITAANERIADLSGQQAELQAQLAAARAQLDAAQGGVDATLAQIAGLEAQLHALQQELDTAIVALAPAQAEAPTLVGLSAAVERDPFDRPELERAAAELGARLRALQAERATAAAEHAHLAGQAGALRAREADARVRLAEITASLPRLATEAAERAAHATAAQTAVAAAETGNANAAAAIRRHKQGKPKPRPGGLHVPGWEPYDEGAIEAWQGQIAGLAADQAQAIERLVTARGALDAAIEARDTAAAARDSGQATAATLASEAAELAAPAAAAEQGAAAAQDTVNVLDPRIAELREARETATARLLGDVGCDRRLVLAPVRLETRFVHDAGGNALLIRIYPDDWFVDSHEPELTADEREWGAHYHAQIAAGADAELRRRAWDQLAERYGPQRAAWIARVLDPATPRDTGERTGRWTRAPQTALLPDRWVAIAHGRDGRHAFCAWSRPIDADPLPVGLAPADDPLDSENARWLTEFGAALDAGMALRVPLAAEHATGLARLVVLGVRADLTDTQATDRLAAALDAHHYTGGLAVPAPGTPSNTTAAGGTGYTRANPDGTLGYATERGAPLVTAGDGSDGALIAAALGIDAGLLAHVAGAGGRSRGRAAAMHTALWGVAGGPLRAALVAAAGADAVRDHLPAAVRAGGPLPALRVGFQPYGLVPATSLQRWAAGAGDPPAALAAALQDLLVTWRTAAGGVPRATPGMPLAALLIEHAYSVRFTVPGNNGGPPLVIEPGVQPGGSEEGPLAPDYVALLRDADRVTVEDETFAEWPDARTGPRPQPLLYLLLRAAVLSDTDGRVAAALDDLAGATPAELRTALLEALDTASHRLDAWITSLATARMEHLEPGAVRFGAYGWLENLTPGAPPVSVPVEPGQPALVERPDNQGHLLAPSLAHAATAAVLRSGYLTHRDDPGSPLAIDLSSRRVGEAEWILRGVQKGQPLAALLGYRFERLLADTGLQRHLAPLRTLAGLRGEDALEKARTAVTALEGDTATLSVQYSKLATASTQAGNDLVARTSERLDVENLRDDYDRKLAALNQLLANAGTADSELTTATVRVKDHLRDRPKPVIRENAGDLDNDGKPIKDIEEVNPAVLQAWQDGLARLQGEQRTAAARAVAAHAASDPTAPRRAELPPLIATLNDKDNPKGVPAALVAEDGARIRAGEAATQAALKEGELRGTETRLTDERKAFATLLNRQWAVASESVAANNVVDGLELHRRYRAGRSEDRWDATTIPFGDAALGFGGDAQTALVPALDDLADAVDAVGDLVVAESLHQIVLGNPLRSGATLDAVARGEHPPPELEVIRTPRRGIGLTHRVVVLLDSASTVAPAWGADAASPRAAAEPQLNAWVSRLLPDPARVACRVELRAQADGAVLATRELQLDALGLAPLDVAHLAARRNPGGLSELEQRLALHAMATRPAALPADAQPRVLVDRDPSWPATVLSVADLLHAIGAVQRMLVQARGLDARDLGAVTSEIDGDDLDRRSGGAMLGAEGVRDALDAADLDDLRTALVGAAGFGIAGALPASPAGDNPADREVLRAQARSVKEDLSARLARAEATAASTERLAMLFGEDFPVLGRFAAPGLAELLGGGDNDRLAGGQHLDLVGWLQRVAYVRPGVQRLSAALAAAETLDAGDRLRLQVGQLPVRAPDRWVGLAPAEGFPLGAGRISIVAHTPADAASGTPVCGLLLDEWVEVVPSKKEIAGVTFNFNQPGARAPQAILVAVAPDTRPERQPPTWDLDTLEAVVQETWELAWARIVDPALLRAHDPALTGVLVDDAVDLARAAEPGS